MRMPPALLERWMRDYYFATEIDIGSSGVEDYSLAELRRIAGFSWQTLDSIVFHDSQTLGGDGLRRAIASRWADGDSRRVMATHGSSEANFLLMNALLARGDEVVVADPCYPQLYAIAEAKGCVMKRWPLKFESGFTPDLEELAALLGPRTRMVVVNFPQNPTGASITLEQLREMVAMIAVSGAYLVWDNAFGEITYGRPPLPDPTAMYERAIALGTLSKCFGLPGLRVGWCIAAPAVLAQCVEWRDYVTLHLSPLVEAIATAAIEHTDALIAPRLEQARANLALVAEWMHAHREWVDWVPPQGGVCVFPRLPASLEVDEFCRRLAHDKRVLLVPGTCFASPRHVRLGFGGPTVGLREALARLSDLLADSLASPRRLSTTA
jgi:capreomycidine synthase